MRIQLQPNQTNFDGNDKEEYTDRLLVIDIWNHLKAHPSMHHFTVYGDVDAFYCLEDDGSMSCFNNIGPGVARYKRLDDGIIEKWSEFAADINYDGEPCKNTYTGKRYDLAAMFL